MVTRSTARTWNDIDKATQKAYHKSHINKTMGIAFTGYAFGDRIDNVGEGVKLVFFRAEVAKLVHPGGRFAGYKVIFLGDNAGPHQDKKILKFVESYGVANGWHW